MGDTAGSKVEENNAEVKRVEAPVDDVKSNDSNADNKEKEASADPSKVEIKEESPTSSAPEGDAKSLNEEQQPKPIIEEPNSNTVPQLNVIPDGSENTVITEIISNETPSHAQEEKQKVEERPKPEELKKDILDAAMESVKAKPPPAKKPASTIVRDSEAPDLS